MSKFETNKNKLLTMNTDQFNAVLQQVIDHCNDQGVTEVLLCAQTKLTISNLSGPVPTQVTSKTIGETMFVTKDYR